jgi:hypothetical protein
MLVCRVPVFVTRCLAARKQDKEESEEKESDLSDHWRVLMF